VRLKPSIDRANGCIQARFGRPQLSPNNIADSSLIIDAKTLASSPAKYICDLRSQMSTGRAPGKRRGSKGSRASSVQNQAEV
jgi:hypothetical protein